MADLARRICEFMVSLDPYNANDCYDNFEDFVTETISGLYDKRRRKGIAADLKGTAEWCEIDADAYEASMLYREVMSL